MRKPPQVALIAAGKLKDSPVTRFTGLHAQLGPVKAHSLRVASRVVNNLRAGHPVPDFEEFAGCSLILLSVPADQLHALEAELAASDISWRGKAVLALANWREPPVRLADLERLGASVGTLIPIPGMEDRRYFVEGDPVLVRAARRLLEHGRTRLLVIERGLSPLASAALNCSGPVLFSLLTATTKCLRLAGLSQPDTVAIIDHNVHRTLRAYLKAGKNAHPGRARFPHLPAVARNADPRLADYVDEMGDLAAALPPLL